MIRIEKTQETIFLIIAFTILTLGFSCNFFHVSPNKKFGHFDDYSESLSMGRISRGAQDGIFSYGALPGVNYNKDDYPENSDILTLTYSLQEAYYINDNMPADFDVYYSQTGGHLTLFSIINKVLPFHNSINFHILHTINAILSALCFVLILGWAYRNFGLVSASVMLLLITLSPWLTYYGYSLWWGLWCMYIPFVVTLLVLERNYKHKMSTTRIIFYIALSVFVKCVFNGFEIITTSLVAIICPIVFYYYLEKKKFIDFILFSAKVTFFSILAVVLEMLLLIVQVRCVKGTFWAGIEHIIISYQVRTQIAGDSIFAYYNSYPNLLRKYLKDNAFEWGFLPDGSKPFFFVFLFILMAIMGACVYFLSRGLTGLFRRRNTALLLTSAFSILAPMSWLIIFKQHSANHFHLDYIVWYVPFALYGFLVIGEFVSLLLYRLGFNKKAYSDI